MRSIPYRSLTLLLILLFARPAAAGADLSKVYPGKMGWSQTGLFPVCSREDVYRLKRFQISLGSYLRVSCDDATVAFGVYEKNVLWAAIFPDEPGKILSGDVGNKERAKTIFLRFPPAEIDEIFPPPTVGKQEGAWRRAFAVRMAQRKVCWRWCTPAGNPTIVQAGWRLVDVDTVEGPRRFWALDTKGGKSAYIKDFEDQPLPDLEPITKREAHRAFDEIWEAFDKEYAGFVLLKKLSWKKVGARYRKELDRVDSVFGTAAVIAGMLEHLEDLHVYVKAGDDWLPGYTRDRPLNASWEAVKKEFAPLAQAGKNLWWGRKDDIGYVNVDGLTNANLPDLADEVLEKLKDTKAMIVDLRFNGGGGELIAREVAGRFVIEKRVYSLNQYRTGPRHNQLGEKLERAFEPRGPWRYDKPVVLLQGRKTMSSAESMALMFAQCPNVTTMGDFTAGSSANPKLIQLDCGITVRMPTWLDMDPDGNPIEHVGIEPEKRIETKREDFTPDHDPVLEAALTFLRKK